MRCRYNKNAFCAVFDVGTFCAGFAFGVAMMVVFNLIRGH